MRTGTCNRPAKPILWPKLYANMNNDYLGTQDIWPRVRSIRVNAGNNTVYVSVEADLSVMFPSIVPQLIVEEGGEAQVRSFRR